MNKEIILGVVGCGYWGPNLIRNFRSLPDCELKYVCDRDKERLQRMKDYYPEVQCISDFDVIIKDKDVNAVVIATPVQHHFPLAKKCLQSGCHTLIEKPMAASRAECEELIELAKKNGCILMVGHTFLYSPSVRKVKNIIESGEIGAVQYINARRLSLGLFQQDIDVVWDLAPHDISIILYLLNQEPIAVNCHGHSHITEGLADVSYLNLIMPDGTTASVHNSWLDPKKVREMTIVGSRGMIIYDDVEPMQQVRIYDIHVNRNQPAYPATFDEFHYAYHYGGLRSPFIKQEEPLKIECQHFLDCIRYGKEPITDAQAAMCVVGILESASVSLNNGGSRVEIIPTTLKPRLENIALARRKDLVKPTPVIKDIHIL